GAEYVHRELPRRLDGRVALRLLRHADQHERRGARHRGERAGGEPGGASVGVPGGDDGHPGGEMTHRTAEVVGPEHLTVVAIPAQFFKFSKGLDGTTPGRPALTRGPAAPILRPRHGHTHRSDRTGRTR